MMNAAISGNPVDSCPKHRKIRVAVERTVRERERSTKTHKTNYPLLKKTESKYASNLVFFHPVNQYG